MLATGTLIFYWRDKSVNLMSMTAIDRQNTTCKRYFSDLKKHKYKLDKIFKLSQVPTFKMMNKHRAFYKIS